MKFLVEYSNWNPSLNKDVKDFISLNKHFLFSNLYDRNKSDEENEKDLIEYFTEYPELMSSDLDLDKIKSLGSQTTIKNSTPTLMNIGGVNDFRSF